MSRRVYTSDTIKFTALALILMVLIKVFVIDGIEAYRASTTVNAPLKISMIDVTPFTPAETPKPKFALNERKFNIPDLELSIDLPHPAPSHDALSLSQDFIGPFIPEGYSKMDILPKGDNTSQMMKNDGLQENSKIKALDNSVTLAPGEHPKIVIVIDDMGLARKFTQDIIDLPAPLTLAFLPYAQRMDNFIAQAKEKNHELIIHVPMEPMNSDLNLGPYGLTSDLSKEMFITRLNDHIFNAFDGYVGINNHMGSRLTQNPQAMGWVMQELKRRKLFFLDSKTIASSIAADVAAQYGVAYAQRDVFLDHFETYESVQNALLSLEKVAKNKGVGIAIGHPKAHTIKALQEWIPQAKEKGFDFVHVSAIVHRSKAGALLVSQDNAPALEKENSVSKPIQTQPSNTIIYKNIDELRVQPRHNN